MPTESDILTLIVHNTVAVKTIRADKHDEWETTVRRLISDCPTGNNSDLVNLLDAVLRLLTTDTHDSIQPELPAPYAACWEAIVDGIESSSPPASNPVQAAVLELVNARTIDERKKIVVQRSTELLNDEADNALLELARLRRDNVLLLQIIEQCRSLLADCRQKGIDEAFAALLNPATMTDIPPQLLDELASARSDEDLRRVLAKHPSLLPVLERMFRSQQPKGDLPLELQTPDSSACDDGGPGPGEYIQFLRSCDIELPLKFTLSILSELSCSPWKFDILWDVWPALDWSHDRLAPLADAILGAEDPSIQLFSMAAFDDLTIFADIVGNSPLENARRAAYRGAYLLLRHMVSRHQLDAPPLPPHAMTQDRYITRIALVGTTLPESILPDVHAVLLEAAERYAGHGKADSEKFCIQTSRLLVEMKERDLLKQDADDYAGNFFPLMMSADRQALAYEIAINWWPLTENVGNKIEIKDPNDQESAAVLQDFLEDIGRLAPFAWLSTQRPGIASTMPILTMLRLHNHLPPPRSLVLFPRDRLGACQEAIIYLKSSWDREPKPPQEIYDSLVDAFVEIGHLSRYESTVAGADEDFFRANALITAEVMSKARQRARQELSQDQYVKSLASIKEAARAHPFAVEGLLHLATALGETKALQAAVFEAVSILVRYTENANLFSMVYDALAGRSRDPAHQTEMAERLERQGRPGLAAQQWYNLGVRQYEHCGPDACIPNFERCRKLLADIAAGSQRVPSTTVFDRVSLHLKLARAWSGALFSLAQYSSALRVIDDAFSAIANVPSGISEDLQREEKDYDRVLLYIVAAECYDKLGNNAMARERVNEARTFAESTDSDQLRALAAAKGAVFSRQDGDWEQALEMYELARHYADRYRRSLPYELDKTDLNIMQAGFVWGGELLLERERAWEALSAFDGARGRALLDLIGVSRAIDPPADLPDDIRQRGVEILEAARAIACPGVGGDAFGMKEHWRRALATIDEWLVTVRPSHPEYADIVQGRCLTREGLEHWAESVTRDTALMFWMLGHDFSYQAVVKGYVGKSSPSLIFRRTPVTISSLRDQSAMLHDAVRNRRNPPRDLLEKLSDELIAPVADLLEDVDVVYVCPGQVLHSVPVHALYLCGEPLNTQKEVGIVPSISLLRALEYIDRSKAGAAGAGAAVVGPEFLDYTKMVTNLLGGPVVSEVPGLSTDPQAHPLARCGLLHFVCHGFHSESDPWESGLVVGERVRPKGVLCGRELMSWGLQARLAVLEACDTRRNSVSVTDDSFGLARFFHIAGVPSLLLADWEVRNDVSARFMSAFYGELFGKQRGAGMQCTRGHAYKTAVRRIRSWAGDSNVLLWAPFALLGVID